MRFVESILFFILICTVYGNIQRHEYKEEDMDYTFVEDIHISKKTKPYRSDAPGSFQVEFDAFGDNHFVMELTLDPNSYTDAKAMKRNFIPAWTYQGTLFFSEISIIIFTFFSVFRKPSFCSLNPGNMSFLDKKNL